MKTHLIFHNIYLFFRDHRIFGILLCAAQLLGIIILLFAAAAIQSISAKQKEIDSYSHFFEVYTSRHTDGTEMVETGYTEENGKRVPIYEECPALDIDSMFSFSEVKERTMSLIAESPIESQPIISFNGICEKKDRFSISTNLTSDVPAAGTVELNSFTFPDYHVGDEFHIGGNTYTVAKMGDFLPDIIVAPQFLPENWKCTRIRLVYDTPPTTKQAEEMKSLLIKYFEPEGEMYIPETVDPLTVQFNSAAMLCTFLMMLAVLMNICYAQLYRFQLEKHSFAVYRLVGGSTNMICSLCLSEVMLITIPIYAVGVTVFHFLLKQYISPWYEAANSLYTARYYLIFGVCYLLFQIALMISPLTRLAIRSAASAEKEVCS